MNNGGLKDIDFRFPRRLFGVFTVIALLSAYPLFTYARPTVIHACVAGAILSLLNALAGYAAVEYSFHKPSALFFNIIFGGIGIRLLFILGAMVILIEMFHVDVIGLVVSLLFFYVIYLIMEIAFIQQKAKTKN